MRRRPNLFALVLSCAVAACASGPRVPSTDGVGSQVLRFGSVVDGTGRVIPGGTIIVRGDRIVRVLSANEQPPAGAEVVDLRRYTAIPGLIDVHTHMTYYWDQAPGSNPWRQPGRPPAQTVLLARENLRHTLETGVTTVRDLGASNYTDIALRDSINHGSFVGPRMFVAGYGLQRGMPRAGIDTNPTTSGRVFNISQIPAAVKRQVDAGADYIKMYGSTGSGADVTGRETFTYDEMKAAVDAAHQYGKRIAIHSYGPEGGRDATRAGAESLEHAVDLDDATIADMVRRGTVYVPTIDHNRYYSEYREQFAYTAEQAAALDAYRARNIETARRAFRAGVKFAMGSDAVFTMFGQNTRELRWFVDIGMTPAQALATATTNAAALLGMEKSLGIIAPGYFADIVGVEGNPLADIGVVVDKVRWVMKGGTVVVRR
jgi:imidazolonepropionase-like amidohydrolase